MPAWGTPGGHRGRGGAEVGVAYGEGDPGDTGGRGVEESRREGCRWDNGVQGWSQREGGTRDVGPSHAGGEGEGAQGSCGRVDREGGGVVDQGRAQAESRGD